MHYATGGGQKPDNLIRSDCFFSTLILLKMASINGTDNKVFQNLQISLNDLALGNAPNDLMPQVGMLDAVTSPENTGGLSALTFEVLNGKDKPQNTNGKPSVQVRSIAPTDTYANTGSKNICDADTGDADPYIYTTVTVDQDAWREFTIDYSTFANLNENPEERIAVRVAQHCKDILTQINNNLGTLAYAAVGDYKDGVDSATSPRAIPIINTSGAYQPLALAKVINEYRQNKFNGRPIVVGGSKIETARIAAAFQGTGQFTTPVNPQLPASLYADYLLDSTLNNAQENAISWIPGTVRLVEWFKNEKYNQVNMETHQAKKINYMGFEFDVDIVYVCDKKFKFTISKQYGIFTPTEQMFGSVNKPGLFAWTLDCAALGCADF